MRLICYCTGPCDSNCTFHLLDKFLVFQNCPLKLTIRFDEFPMKPIRYSRRRTSRPSTDHHMVGACDLNGSQSRYSMEHIHHESNYFILLQHKSIYLDGEPHVVLTLLCRAQLHVEQIMLLHSLVAHSRRQSIMFHAGESYDGTALKSTVHCRPMERCRQFDDG